MINMKEKDYKREISLLKKEVSLLKRSVRKKFNLVINELQELGSNNKQYEVVFDEQPITSYYDGLIEKVKTSKSFKDVILSKDVKAQLDIALSQIKNRYTLIHKWKLNKLQNSNAISLNFAGISGTGKTLTAEVLANELGKKIYIVRYSNLVDSYIGETGKNIVKVFEIAKKDNAILFFDEADAIASSRTAIFNATDAETNLTRNVLLKELEKFEGIVIFATNLVSNFDKAFERRISLHVIFKMPNIMEREKIWKLLSNDLPLAKDVDFNKLAKEFEFTGGHIRNAVLNAARIAIHNKSNEVKQEHFLHAAKLVKEGYNTLMQQEGKTNLNYLG